MGELIRCIDTAKTCSRLSSEAFIGIFRLINASEPDVFRWVGLRLLLESLRPTDNGIHENVDAGALNILDRNLIRTILEASLKKSIANQTDDEIGCRTMREILVGITKDMYLSTAESPMDVSARTILLSYMKADSAHGVKRKRFEILDSYEDSSVFDLIANDDIQGEILEKWTLPAADTVNSKQNDAKIPSQGKKQRMSSGRVTGKGSPLPRSARSTITREPLLSYKQSLDIKAKQQTSVKKKDRLQDSIKRPSVKLPIVVDKGSIGDVLPQIQDASQPVHSKPRQGIHWQIKDVSSFQNSIPYDDEAISTPLAAKPQSPETQSAPLKADQLAFDKYFNFENDAIIQSQVPENIFSSPVRLAAPTQAAVQDQIHRQKISQNEDGAELVQDSQAPSAMEDLEGGVEMEGNLHSPAKVMAQLKYQQHITPISVPFGSLDQSSNRFNEPSTSSITSMNSNESTLGIHQVEDTVLSMSGQMILEENDNSENRFVASSIQAEVKEVLQNQFIKPQHVKPPEAILISSDSPEGSKEALKDSPIQVSHRVIPNNVASLSPNPRKRNDDRKVFARKSSADARSHSDRHSRSSSVEDQIDLPLTKVRPSVRKPDGLPSTRNVQSRPVQKDPEVTLVHHVNHTVTDSNVSIIDCSLEMSSTTTESRSSPPLIEDDPDLLQQIIELFRNLDIEILTLLHPIILLLMDTIQPLTNARNIIQTAFSAYDNTARNMIESLDAQFRTTNSLRQQRIYCLIDSQLKHLTDLRKACERPN